MARYRYLIQDKNGKKKRLVGRAPSEEDLYRRLREEGKFLISCKEIPDTYHGKKLNARQLAEFCRQLGTLLASGITMVKAFDIIIQEETISQNERKIYQELLRMIRQGMSLSDSMEKMNGVFPDILIHMFRSAEMGGKLEKTATRMSTHFEKEHKLDAKVQGAMTYPIILSILIVVAVIFILVYVVPQFSDLFSTMERLPLPTRIILGICDAFKNYWIFILAGAILVVGCITFVMQLPPVKFQRDKLKLHLPIIGKLLSIIYTARLARTLSSLYAAGLPMLSILQIARKTVGNAYVDSQFDEAIKQIQRGEKLSESIKGIRGFNKKLISSIVVGEETGNLDVMLESISESLEYDSEIAISKLVGLLEPIMIIVMALIIGFIMISVMMPMIGSYNALENTANM